MPKLSAMMIVHNEAERYLNTCLKSLSNYVDEIIILDDASTDETADICLRFPIVRLFRQYINGFLVDESLLRRKLWDYCAENDPEWILAIDADELFEPAAIHEFPYLIKQTEFNAISFRLFDCWGCEEYYRADGFWNPWKHGFAIYMIRYLPLLDPSWPDLPYHCGRIPLAYRNLPHYECDLRLKHLGWADPKDIKAKYLRSVSRDPANRYLCREHNESIICPPEKIILEKWNEQIT